MNKRKELLEKHPYSIWEGSDGNWYTYVPDDTKKRGIALRKRGSESKINDFVVEYWQEQQRNKRNVVIYNYYGENLTLRQIAIKEKVNYDKLRKMVTKEGIDIFESLKCLKK